MQLQLEAKQRGITLIGVIFIMAILGVIGVLGLKVVPTVIEFQSIKKAMATAKAAGNTPVEIKSAFDKQTNVGYIESVSSKDLELSKDGDHIEVSIAYQKKIPLFGPASLLIDYAATTATTTAKKPDA